MAVNAGVALLCTNTCGWFCPQALATRMRGPRDTREGRTAQLGDLNLVRQPHLSPELRSSHRGGPTPSGTAPPTATPFVATDRGGKLPRLKTAECPSPPSPPHLGPTAAIASLLISMLTMTLTVFLFRSPAHLHHLHHHLDPHHIQSYLVLPFCPSTLSACSFPSRTSQLTDCLSKPGSSWLEGMPWRMQGAAHL